MQPGVVQDAKGQLERPEDLITAEDAAKIADEKKETPMIGS